jgi:competence protein ComEC
LLAWVGATALQLQQAQLFSGWVYGTMVVAGLALVGLSVRLSLSSQLRGGALVASAALLAFAATGIRADLFLSQALAPQLQGRDITVTGVVASMVQRNETGMRFQFDVESARDGEAQVKLPPKIYLSWYAQSLGLRDGTEDGDSAGRPLDLKAGARWQMVVRLKVPHGGSNPHGFDYELWLWEQGLQATGYVRAGPNDPAPQQLAQSGLQAWAHPIERARQHVRDAILARVSDRKLAGVIAALTVGDQNAIDRADWDVFRATGVAHLMSISGLHITMFAWGAALLVGWLWRRSGRLCQAFPAPNAAVLGGVILALAYSLFSGWGLPAQRTVLMLATVGLLRMSGKRWPWPQTWMLACAVVVLADPWALLQAGFWLSFVAVGVLFATDAGSQASDESDLDGPPEGWAARAFKTLAATFREQWVITLALTPLTLLLFGQVSLVGLLANALAIPWVTLVVTPLAILGTIVAPFWDMAALAIQALSVYLSWLNKLPFASVSIAQAPVWAGVAGLAGGLLLVMRLPWFMRVQGIPLLLPVLLWQAPRPELGHFELLAADIGQGNAVIVRTANHALVYDAGPRFSRESDAGHRVVVPLLRALDVRVDTVVLSHRDSDHTGGAQAVLAMQPQAQLLSSLEDEHVLQTIRKSTRCVAGQRWTWDGVAFEVLHPQAADYDMLNKSNAMSCVLRIDNGSQVALLTGDIEQAQEASLVADGAKLKADVLLVPHHGSKTSSSAEFLDAVQPRFALVQSGFRNRFSHPAPIVMARYAERAVQVFDSPTCGAATWNSSAPDIVKCHRLDARRYWNHDLQNQNPRVSASAQ